MDDEEVEEQEEVDLSSKLNPNSLEVLDGCKVEPSLAGAEPGSALPVRAAGLLLRGPGHDGGEAGVQPDGGAEGYLGEGEGTEGEG